MKRQAWSRIRKPVYDFSKLKSEDADFLKQMSEEKDVYPVEITFKEIDDYKRLWFYFVPIGEVENEQAEIRFLDKIPFWRNPELYAEDSELTHPLRVGEDWTSVKIKMSQIKIPLIAETRYKGVLSTSVYQNFQIGSEIYTGWTLKLESLAPMDAVMEMVVAKSVPPAISLPPPSPKPPAKTSKRALEKTESEKPKKKAKSMLELVVEPVSPTSEVYVDLDDQEMEKNVNEYEERISEHKRGFRSKFGKL
jgi:hypothetical protein